jgi:hypothetical protein
MGIAVTFVMALASLFTYFVYYYILVPLSLTYLNTIAFILVIASLVQVVEMFLKKSAPSLYGGAWYLPAADYDQLRGAWRDHSQSRKGTTCSTPCSTARSARWASCWQSY